MPRQFHFVSVVGPAEPSSTESRTAAHAHAIRRAHANARRIRTQRYQASVRDHGKDLTTGAGSMHSHGLPDPFSALVKPLSSEDQFLLHHYVQNVVPLFYTHCPSYNGNIKSVDQSEVLQDWVGLATTDSDLLNAIFLGACRDILLRRSHDQHLMQKALKYKQHCLEVLRKALAPPSKMNNLTVAKAIAMVLDDILSASDEDRREIYKSVETSTHSITFRTAIINEQALDQYLPNTSLSNSVISVTMASPKTVIPAGATILVTGATGFVSSHVTKQLLERGYKVRGTVRNAEQASWLVDDVFKTYASQGLLELVAVPDLGATGAFDDAIKGVSAVAHVATISSFDPDPNNVIPQTIAGIVSILEAAMKEPLVKSIVYTSSQMAATGPFPGNDTRVERDTWNDFAVEAALAPPPYEPSRGPMTYAASKVLAEKEVWKFVEERSPHFSVNVVSPSAIIGAPLHKKHTESVSWVGRPFNGNKEAMDPMPALFFVDVKDIALLHIACMLDPEVKNQRLHAWGHSGNWNDLLAILRKLRPQRDFIPDLENPQHLTISTDPSDSLNLLKKWVDQDGWRPLERSVLDNIENPWFV
ncbi:hypothetical protein B0J13DRAFT_504888 [Dactylonectria estremocensis]|uniref:NAD-dependent epimerase/dehydratase domain-containing protein n=1 Tax=Dactylonectria estremocensis TaxID=1079267 RepID=A0A9P9J1A4_9HYPO|nr:hypothetical protein B0J13DRAFT_504888 [Dactylonectria estremocensis]